MKVHFAAYVFSLQLAYVKASPFLSTSASISLGLDTNTVFTSSPTASPTCFQPRASSDPPASQISSALTDSNAVADACSNTTILSSKNDTIHYDAGAYSFNISKSRNVDPTSGIFQVQAPYCSQTFQNIISICVLQRSFWGGWAQVGNSNWSISNKVYPRNLLPLPKLVDTSSPNGQLSKTEYRDSVSTTGSLKPVSTIVSDDPNRLILAIENVVSIEKISLSAVAAAVSNTNGSTRSISSRQSLIQSGAAFDPSTSPTTSIRTSAAAIQGISSTSVASFAPKTEQSKSSPTTKQSSQYFQQAALETSVRHSTSSIQISELQSPTTASFQGALVGGNRSANVTPISGPLTIAPDYTITDAFQSGLNRTTISASNGAVLVYSMRTFSDLANSTGTPVLVQTTVSETLASGSHVAFIGGVWVASGGRFWFPPGIPKPESDGGLKLGFQISPPCIWPFCSGKITSNGGGGGDPEGDPPPPYEPPNPPPAYAPPADGSGEEPDQETQDSQTRSKDQLSQIRSQSAEKTNEQTSFPPVSPATRSSSSAVLSAQRTTEQTISTSLPSFSTVSRATTSSSSAVFSPQRTTDQTISTSLPSFSTASHATMSSSSIVSSSSIPAYGIANLSDGKFIDYNLSIADANSAALDEESLINAITIPNGIMWAPTGAQELAWAAQATLPFDLALPTFESLTEAPSSPSSKDSMSSQRTTSGTGSRYQTTSSLELTRSSTADAKANAASEKAVIFALSKQLASSSAVAAANKPPLITPAPEALTTPPFKPIPIYVSECSQT